ncbi:Selenocysteine-specific elongation factor [Klebsormidium nitens]|uniref:Selenocysteine-specific elongation factor n=1 Tax=Klebsormidium nitens TaxID=105231 RepID=A0A1Y1HSA0_KLENI|nr:Selenocysteine-specific elongation factor [Klebsormidium nitens]|eukprot:GAQ81505.1 Selenocysteine-specific elongation factor [Klebsormidium nitens]
MGSEKASAADGRIMNVNVGILGHIDSGKTSLARALSTLLSTAALDKHPQSLERGITLDLGFSAFQVDLPEHLASLPFDKLQFTLVDCPGHASLIKTIIGGAQIIDVMLLVIDVTKGIQTQTAECLIVGEVSPCHDMVVVLNKVDLLPDESRDAKIEKMKNGLRKTFAATKFRDCAMVATSASPGGPDGRDQQRQSSGVDELVNVLRSRVRPMHRSSEGSFLFAVDHCFPIRGQGTVLTGTVLRGHVAVNQSIELPELKVQKKVKSMQMFHRPVQRAIQGDRVGLCVTQLDAKTIERGLAAEPGTVPTIFGALARVHKIRYFKGRIPSKAKFHVTAGHSTVMAETRFFSSETGQRGSDERKLESANEGAFDFERDYWYQEELLDEEATVSGRGDESTPAKPGAQWVFLTFETPITCPLGALLIGSRLDTDIHTNTCRLAFHGRLLQAMDPRDKDALQSLEVFKTKRRERKLRVFKTKRREGVIERYVDGNSAVGRGLFKKETDISQFVGLRVTTEAGEEGTIQSSFGKSGKFKLHFPGGVQQASGQASKVTLEFKRFIYDRSKRMIQL